MTKVKTTQLVLSALEAGGSLSRAKLELATGKPLEGVRRALTELKKAGAVHVCGWEKSKHRSNMPVWALGLQPGEPRPRKIRSNAEGVIWAPERGVPATSTYKFRSVFVGGINPWTNQ